MERTTISKVKNGDYFKFSENGKVFQKESGGKVIHKYCPMDDFCDNKQTRNGKRKVLIGFEY